MLEVERVARGILEELVVVAGGMPEGISFLGYGHGEEKSLEVEAPH